MAKNLLPSDSADKVSDPGICCAKSGPAGAAPPTGMQTDMYPADSSSPTNCPAVLAFGAQQDRHPHHLHHLHHLVVVGRNTSTCREAVQVRLDADLLRRLSAIASGSRSTLIELAIAHMVESLALAQLAGEPVVVVDAMDVQRRLFGK